MIAEQKGLVLVFREESSDDFQEIARRIYELDSSIFIVGCPNQINVEDLPEGIENMPLLVVYLVNPPAYPTFHQAPMLAVRTMDKLEEYEYLRKCNLPYLPIEQFTWGMELDPAVYGEWVVIKPQYIQSTGEDVNMLPTHLIPTLRPANFPEEHLIHKDNYFVQKFIKCGNFPTSHRALIFLNEVILSVCSVFPVPYPNSEADLKTFLSVSVASNQQNQRTSRSMYFHKDEESNQLALEVAKYFPKSPLLGVDIIRDGDTGDLYVLELNLGGNAWHFSSKIGENVRILLGGRDAMVVQYNAWDKAAEALIRKTHELASLTKVSGVLNSV